MDSRKLRLQTLRRIGGALQIVDKHVNDVLTSLPRDSDREIAAKMFRYLVTPSRSKIAQDMESLIGFGEAHAVTAAFSPLSPETIFIASDL